MSESDVEDELIWGVIFAHGQMAQGIVDAVSRISGISGALVAISNDGKGPETMKAELKEAIGDRCTIVFTDMASGSCAMTAALSCKDECRRAVVCGVNLPVLLDFVFHRNLPLEELVPRLIEKGRDGLRSFP
jgi:mannose/fructose-specific phosphotransferase system component IIA